MSDLSHTNADSGHSSSRESNPFSISSNGALDNGDVMHHSSANGSNEAANTNLPQPLNVLVIGGGLGGLTTALALRRAGHKVTVFEQSRLVSESGAAIHMAPNATGVLKRLGVDPEDAGAVEMKWFTEYNKKGDSVRVNDFTEKSRIWQHKYLLAHRADLHTQLKTAATSATGVGIPVELHTSSQVVDVDVHHAILTLKDGSVRRGDLIVGADGVHSRSREQLTTERPFLSGKAAYRFVLNKAEVRQHPELAEIVEKDNEHVFWFDTDRRIVMYPTRNNEVLNFVCIRPDKQEAEIDSGWNQPASMQQLLQDFEGFDERVLGLMRMADESTLKSWALTDMNAVSRWHEGRFCVVGDAAHPFLPHQGQGGAQAIEDGVSLGVIFPLGVTPQEIPDRLSLYQECRKERAEYIQQVTRQSGEDIPAGKRDNSAKVMSFFNYNCGHDEHDHTTLKLRNWLYKQQKKVYWRMPISFGPNPSPRQDQYGFRPESRHSTFVSRAIKFKTSRTVAQNLLPSKKFSFEAPDSFAYASFITTTLDGMEWLGGKGYNYVGLYLHNVRYVQADDSIVRGDYLVVMWENLTDPILTGREEIGFPKLYSEINVEESRSSASVALSWRNAEYMRLRLENLEDSSTLQADSAPGVLFYKYIPATGKPGIADVEYPVYAPSNPAVKVRSLRKTSNCSIGIDVHDRKALPTLHHIVTGLAGLPVYSIEEGTVSEGTGPDDLMSAYRIE